MPKAIYTATNEPDGLECYVFGGEDGYTVVLKDTDADEVIPTVTKTRDLGKAIKLANEYVGTHA